MGFLQLARGLKYSVEIWNIQHRYLVYHKEYIPYSRVEEIFVLSAEVFNIPLMSIWTQEGGSGLKITL